MTTRSAHRSHANVMGTVASIHVYDDVPTADIDVAVGAVLAELERLEDIFSTFRPGSQISRVNRGELTLFDCDAEVIEVMDACTWLEHASEGAFAARRPEPSHALDPAGFVKGWATERAARALTEARLEQWYVSVGGDICTSGAPPRTDRWQFAVADPRDASQAIASVDVPAGFAVATSGIGVRGRHLWHGRTGAAVADFASLTVIGPSLTWADAFATAAFARGQDGLEWLERFDGYVGFAVDHDGTIVRRASMTIADLG